VPGRHASFAEPLRTPIEELRAGHASVMGGAVPTTDVADSRGDPVVLTEMARLMSS